MEYLEVLTHQPMELRPLLPYTFGHPPLPILTQLLNHLNQSCYHPHQRPAPLTHIQRRNHPNPSYFHLLRLVPLIPIQQLSHRRLCYYQLRLEANLHYQPPHLEMAMGLEQVNRMVVPPQHELQAHPRAPQRPRQLRLSCLGLRLSVQTPIQTLLLDHTPLLGAQK
jgi:hypothetical protein